MADISGNLLLLQGGEPTAVSNCTLCGVIEEAVNHEEIEEIYGSLDGISGILSNRFVDLGLEKRKTIEILRRTPGAALGASLMPLNAEDSERALGILKSHQIRFLLVVGGLETVATARRIEEAAASSGYEICLLAITQSALNEIPETDHSPGYGSAARWLAVAARDGFCEVSSRQSDTPVFILQVLGEKSGWLAAATALSREGVPGDGCHLICFPERPLDEDKLVEEVGAILQQYGVCLVVTAEGGVHRSDGSNFPVNDLATTLSSRMNIRCGWSAPNAIQRVSQLGVSRTDTEEAFSVGQTAVRLAVDGASGYTLTLKREESGSYRCITTTTQLGSFPMTVRTLPDDYISERGTFVTEKFLEYARPLIGGPLPEYSVLDKIPVESGL